MTQLANMPSAPQYHRDLLEAVVGLRRLLN